MAEPKTYGITCIGLTAVEQHASVYVVQRWELCITQISLLFNTTAVHGGSAHPARLQIACWEAYILVHSETTRREKKLTAGTPKNEHPCSFLGYKFAGANLLLLETTALLGSFDTLSGGTDAARIKQNQVWQWSNLCSAKYTDVLRWTSDAVDALP